MGAFGYVVIVIGCLGVVTAVVALGASGGLYERIGKGAFSLDEPDRPRGPVQGSPQAVAEAQAEIRQLVEAKSARRQARGQSPLDVEAEIAALTSTAPAGADAELREEVRQLVAARNERRIARGQEPLDVEAEVERQLRDLS